MSYTYEQEDRTTTYETWEWDNAWIEHTDDGDTRRVLYIGDSISVDTRQAINRQAGDTLRCDSFSTSKALDNPYFGEAVRLFAAQQPKRDAILFNNGLHGWHLDDEAEYPRYYEQMVKYLLDTFPHTPVMPVLTTHVASEKRDERVRTRNEAVRAIAAQYGLTVVDLYTPTAADPALLGTDGVHFTPDGWRTLADILIAAVTAHPGE